jgi:predicted site-specific integrase-resolvase
MKNFVTSKEASQILGVHPNTLRNWDKQKEIETLRTIGNKRLYNITKFLKDKNNNLNKEIICYARVSSRGQKDDLGRQIEYLDSRFPGSRIIKDIGSGLNNKRKGLKTILELGMQGKIETLVVTEKDRLTRFGFEIIEFIIERNGGKILVLNKDLQESKYQELVKDILSIIHVFSCRIYGLRKYKKQIKKEFKEEKM